MFSYINIFFILITGNTIRENAPLSTAGTLDVFTADVVGVWFTFLDWLGHIYNYYFFPLIVRRVIRGHIEIDHGGQGIIPHTICIGI